MIQIGVIGAGVMGVSHIVTLAGLAGVKVVAVADPDPTCAQLGATAAGGARILKPEALIADPAVHAVAVVSPDAHHMEQVLRCLERGKPVFCEKPLAAMTAEGQAILRAEAGRGLVQVGFMRRYDPDYRDLREHLRQGKTGQPLLVRMIHRNARAPSFVQGAQAITNAMVHEFDILRWLTGDEVARVRVQSPRAAASKGMIDPVMATIETVGGLLVEIETSMNVRYGYDIRTEVLCTEGALVMAAQSATRRQTAAGEVFSHPVDFTGRFADAYRLQFVDWLAALAAGKGRGAVATAEDGCIALAVSDAAVAALASGDWVEVADAFGGKAHG
jgi:myo-inositol 2-dehydrogenase / D-chiro-inositol 1-dehydrogenase